MSDLLPLDEALGVLRFHEPMRQALFTVGDQIRFDVRRGWNMGIKAKDPQDLVDAYVTLGGGNGKLELQLTKEAMLEATSIPGITFRYACKLPAELLTPQLNYWYREGLLEHNTLGVRDFRILYTGNVAAAFNRAGTHTFSNLEIVDRILDAIKIKYSGEVLVDPNMHHSLRSTRMRLIIPSTARTITGTGITDDRWSLGIHLRNSLTGYEKTVLDGYLYRHATGASAIDVRNPGGGIWTRRSGHRGSEVYDWVRQAADEILDHLPASLDAVQSLTDITIKGHASEILRDVFVHYAIASRDRRRIIESMEKASSLTMYAVMNAVCEAAQDVAPKDAENLMRMAGDLPHAATSRCDSCRRLAHVH